MLLVCLANPEVGQATVGFFALAKVKYPSVLFAALTSVFAYTWWYFSIRNPGPLDHYMTRAARRLWEMQPDLDWYRSEGGSIELTEMGATRLNASPEEIPYVTKFADTSEQWASRLAEHWESGDPAVRERQSVPIVEGAPLAWDLPPVPRAKVIVHNLEMSGFQPEQVQVRLVRSEDAQVKSRVFRVGPEGAPYLNLAVRRSWRSARQHVALRDESTQDVVLPHVVGLLASVAVFAECWAWAAAAISIGGLPGEESILRDVLSPLAGVVSGIDWPTSFTR